MRYFIDAGANNSCSARIFRKKYDPFTLFHIYSFEVDPRFADNFDGIEKLTFINKAVWVEDKVMPFYISNARRHDGGTLLVSKTTGLLDKRNPILVNSIDFSKWLLENFKNDDFIILKMDIEGAEYEVLERMIATNAINLIDELWIEWHYAKVGISKNRHDELLRRINIPIKKWAGLEEAEKVLGKDYLKAI